MYMLRALRSDPCRSARRHDRRGFSALFARYVAEVVNWFGKIVVRRLWRLRN